MPGAIVEVESRREQRSRATQDAVAEMHMSGLSPIISVSQ